MRELVDKLLELGGKEGRDCGPHLGFVADPVDLDLFYETFLDVLLDAVDVQQGMLARVRAKMNHWGAREVFGASRLSRRPSRGVGATFPRRRRDRPATGTSARAANSRTRSCSGTRATAGCRG